MSGKQAHADVERTINCTEAVLNELESPGTLSIVSRTAAPGGTIWIATSMDAEHLRAFLPDGVTVDRENERDVVVVLPEAGDDE